MKRLLRNFSFAAGATMTLVVIVLALFAPWIAPADPTQQETVRRLEAPSYPWKAAARNWSERREGQHPVSAYWQGWKEGWRVWIQHPFGLDDLGRDVFSRVVWGSRVSLRVGLSVVFISSIIGIALGAVSGYFGGWVDTVIMRLADTLLAFPGILLAIALVAVLGPSLNNVVFALSVIGWVGYARLVRGQVLKVREMEFVTAAEAMGAGSPRIIALHLLPSVINPVIVMATLGLAGAILAEASLSFLGLGVQPPTPSWGAMLTAGRRYLGIANHLAIFPGIAIMIAVMGLNFLGDGLIDALDPKYRKTMGN